MLDLLLMLVIAASSVGMAAYGGHLASDKWWKKGFFWGAGTLCFGATIWLGVRSDRENNDKNNAILATENELKVQQGRSDEKLDRLFGLLSVKPIEARKGPISGTKVSSPNPPTGLSATFMDITFGISQSAKISVRRDAPNQTEVVVTSSAQMPNLKMALECDKELIDASPHFDRASMVVSGQWGVLRDHPNIFIYTYLASGSTPPFGPGHPLTIDVWSKQPVNCEKLEVF